MTGHFVGVEPGTFALLVIVARDWDCNPLVTQELPVTALGKGCELDLDLRCRNIYMGTLFF